MAAPLSPKQLKFVAGILAGLSPAEAYVDAGYKGTGKTATNNASRMLASAGIKAELDKHRQKAVDDVGATAKWALAHLKVLALYDGPRSSHQARVQACKAILEYHVEPPPSPSPADVNVNVNVSTTLAGRIDQYEAAFAAAADRQGEGAVPGDGS